MSAGKIKMKIDKEILTDEKMHELFGVNYSGLLYFNYDLGCWNRDVYLGQKIHDQFVDTKHALSMMSIFNADLFKNRREIVAVVAMVCRVVNAGIPVLCERGTSVAGNIVLRDLQNGRILPVADNWVMAARFATAETAIQNAGYITAFNGAHDIVFQDALMTNCVR